MKNILLLVSIGLMLAASTSYAQAGDVTIPLGDPRDVNPDPRVVDVPLLEITEHSLITVWVENEEDPLRFKDWRLTVYIPVHSDPAMSYDPVTQLETLTYGRTAMPPVVVPNVPMVPTTSVVPGWDAYYADTTKELLTPWYAYGTQPVGRDWGRIDIGNPWFVQFVFDVDETIPAFVPVFVSIYDRCIPEPLTLVLLGVGGLLLSRRRKA